MSASPVPPPRNEPVKSYAPRHPERAELRAALERAGKEVVDIPMVIGGASIRTTTRDVTMPHDHQHVVGRAHQGSASHVARAVEAAERAKPDWAGLPFEARASILLKAADLLAGPWRQRMNAATMLGQSKTPFQSEIDAVCELCDFWRFNVAYADQLRRDQPHSPPGMWNRTELRPLDGFVFAVSPFNFTAIAGNLPTVAALMGNTVVWKPAPTQMLSAHVIMELLTEAGLPPGVVNMVQGEPSEIGRAALSSERLAGLHFTGSTKTFQHLWSEIGRNITNYRQYPRIVGETGGKDFIFAHPSADLDALTTAIVRGAFEYQGQKCSAVSRVYVPSSIWNPLKDRLVPMTESIKMGDVRDFGCFMGAVIDRRAFEKITSYIDLATTDVGCSVLTGGMYSDEKGYFVAPTVVRTEDPRHRLMREEIFGPVVAVWVYDDARLEDALAACDQGSEYGLTGAVFAQDRAAAEHVAARLRGTAGNFYINDKPTGAVVGQQPFGGSRASGTNDKAGSAANLLRWTSVRTIKETFVPAVDYRYPYMEADD